MRNTSKKLLMWLAVLTLAGCLSLGGCTGGQQSAQSASAASSAAVSQEAQVSETSVSSQGSGPVLPGVDSGNYPRVDGSTANMPLMAKVYSTVCGVSQEVAESRVTASGGTGAVWRNLLQEGAELLLVYEAPEGVQEEIAQAGLELEINPIGRDGLVFLLNAKNPVENLTTQQLLDIYTGKTVDWQDVGGQAGKIAPFQRNEESGSQTLFLKLLMKETPPMLPPTELMSFGMGGLIDSVAAYDGSGGAIGYSVFYYANLMYANPDLKLLSVDGVAPSTDSIREGSYPFVNDFYVVIRKSEPKESPARLLRDWLLTPAGTSLLVDSGYVPVG